MYDVSLMSYDVNMMQPTGYENQSNIVPFIMEDTWGSSDKLSMQGNDLHVFLNSFYWHCFYGVKTLSDVYTITESGGINQIKSCV